MLSSIISSMINYLVETIGSWGYPGIFLFMAIESTIFPLPSEIILIPAGVLAAQGKMSILLIILISTLGSLAGSLAMYFISLRLGRKIFNNLLIKYGNFFLLDGNTLIKTESYFQKHGEITIFLSRLLPVIRHLISIPAGFAKMPVLRFSLYTCIGSVLWSAILVYSGYYFGLAMAENNMHTVVLAILLFSLVITVLYLIFLKIKKSN